MNRNRRVFNRKGNLYFFLHAQGRDIFNLINSIVTSTGHFTSIGHFTWPNLKFRLIFHLNFQEKKSPSLYNATIFIHIETTWLQVTSNDKLWWCQKLMRVEVKFMCTYVVHALSSAFVISNESQLFSTLFSLNLYFILLYSHLKAHGEFRMNECLRIYCYVFSAFFV